MVRSMERKLERTIFVAFGDQSNMTKKALITGITGQDGSYLAEYLLSLGVEVHGLMRRSSSFSTRRIDHIFDRLHLHYGDVTDLSSMLDVIYKVQPQEIYNLAAQSHVRVSFDMPEYTGDVVALGTTRLLEAVRRSGIDAAFYQASSSEMFGASSPPQSESTPFAPRSPYGAAKLYAYWMARNYREAYGMRVYNGILFNHESARRGSTFVTRKITRGVAAILTGKTDVLYLGNLEAARDWGYAPDYVMAMWAMLNSNIPPMDMVIGTGVIHTVREFVETAFGYAGLDWRSYVRFDQRYFRPTEVDALQADAQRARREIGFRPRVNFIEMVHVMVDADLVRAGHAPIGHGVTAIGRYGLLAPWHKWADQVLSMEG